MGYIRPIPVKREDIKVGQTYFTCSYTGVISVFILKIFNDTKSVLVEVSHKKENKKCKPFVRQMNYIFDNPDMARSAGHQWEHDERKRKNKNNK